MGVTTKKSMTADRAASRIGSVDSTAASISALIMRNRSCSCASSVESDVSRARSSSRSARDDIATPVICGSGARQRSNPGQADVGLFGPVRAAVRCAMIDPFLPGGHPAPLVLKSPEIVRQLVEHHRQVAEHRLVSPSVRQRCRQPIMSRPPTQTSRRGRAPPIRFDFHLATIRLSGTHGCSPRRLRCSSRIDVHRLNAVQLPFRPATAIMPTAVPDVIRLTPTTRPNVQAALAGHAQMMMPASTRSERPLTSIQPHEPGSRSR